MIDKTIVILGTAMNPSIKHAGTTTFGEKRIRQFVTGLERVAELAEKHSFDFAIVDNTITPDWQMPEEIKKMIARIPGVALVFFDDNELAGQNKGCGVVSAWKKVFSSLNMADYQYCVYFEPRQLLLNFNFFNQFVKKPSNYFSVIKYRVTASTKPLLIRLIFKLLPLYRKQFNVGLFSIEKKIFQNYLDKVDLTAMAKNNICLEDDLYNFFEKNGFGFKKTPALGILWHNSSINEYINY